VNHLQIFVKHRTCACSDHLIATPSRVQHRWPASPTRRQPGSSPPALVHPTHRAQTLNPAPQGSSDALRRMIPPAETPRSLHERRTAPSRYPWPPALRATGAAPCTGVSGGPCCTSNTLMDRVHGLTSCDVPSCHMPASLLEIAMTPFTQSLRARRRPAQHAAPERRPCGATALRARKRSAMHAA